MSKVSNSTVLQDDNQPRKFFPTGLRALAKSIRKYWPHDLELQNPAAAKTFPPEFREKHEEMLAMYGKMIPLGFEASIRGLESNTAENRRDITFSDIRAYAEYVGPIPAGLFLVYSQLTSKNRQGDERDKQVEFLEDCERALRALKEFVQNSQNDPDIEPFIKSQPDKTDFQARLVGLKVLVDAFTQKQGIENSET